MLGCAKTIHACFLNAVNRSQGVTPCIFRIPGAESTVDNEPSAVASLPALGPWAPPAEKSGGPGHVPSVPIG